ncbi:HD domain-containing protein [Acidovorax sp. 69]|uniref:HD-GYP domain-containing protein n=1 Tax=Acidovorax sp. 69 TaxID=2035202 RepID=UPI000C234D8A|nr:HD-GYP domain-containing protein [Acidovorax sp. 69]PJI98231.1 HD domain-containing protein [Acidovorax sp. 69]
MNSSILIDISQLRVGMYIQLDVGWMHHPFPVSSFRVASADQITTLRGLGLTEVRYVPKKSDPALKELVPAAWSVPEMISPPTNGLETPGVPAAVDPEAARRRLLLDAQNRALAACNQRFAEATRQYQALERAVSDHPDQARDKGEALVSGCVSELLENGDSVIRLLSEGVGERNALHPINVMVISLLLGRSLGMQSAELHDLGVAALIHDLGKLKLPPNLRQPTPSMPLMERSRYETHVGESVAMAKRMGLSDAVLTAVARHHEMADGSGFPLRLSGADLGRTSQVLALVNRYDRMCNPAVGVDALTPHEALSVIFAQLKARFDSVVLGAFIRMMGVYPPGSIVQLVNDRYAIVASVNSSRPLRPRVIVHDSRIPKDEAPILDLETVPELGIRRSLKPAQLPRDALDYLSPRQRICYFFERAVSPDPDEAGA